MGFRSLGIGPFEEIISRALGLDPLKRLSQEFFGIFLVSKTKSVLFNGR
jgi:hypothetical protein